MQKNNRLYFRADMNKEIATGHIMRCLSIADAAKNMGIECCFITADINPVEVVTKKGYRIIVLGSEWDKLDDEIGVMLTIISSEKIEHLLVDSYKVTENYLCALKEATKVTYMDDLDMFTYPAHMVVNYDCAIDRMAYAKKYSEKSIKTLMGYDYIPLRDEFKGLPPKDIKESRLNLLIMSGGADELHAIKRILDSIDFCSFATVVAVCGRYNGDYDSLCLQYENENNVLVVKNVPDLVEYMKSADICISAAGNTMYELAACGVPTILYVLSEYQVAAAESFNKLNVVDYIGAASDMAFEENIKNALQKMIMDSKRRENLSKKMQSVVDGNGSERIAKTIMDL